MESYSARTTLFHFPTLTPKASNFPSKTHFDCIYSFRQKISINPFLVNMISVFKEKPNFKYPKFKHSNLNQSHIHGEIGSKQGDLGLVLKELHKEKLVVSLIKNQSYTQILQLCIKSEQLEDALELYFRLKDEGFEPGIVIETIMINSFMKSGWVNDAFQVFDKMLERNVVTWTSMISGCIRNGLPEIGYDLFVRMLESGVRPNDFSYNVSLQACADLVSIDDGKQVHSLAVKAGFSSDCRIENCLIDLYAKCGYFDDAHKVFAGMAKPDLVSFTSLITGFSQNRLFGSALEVFDQMLRMGIHPNTHTIGSVLTACDGLLGEQIHAYMIKNLLDRSPYSVSSLVEFYSKNSLIERAKVVFEKSHVKNVVTWSGMIACYVQNERVDEALKLFSEMVISGVEPNEFTFATAISACRYCSEFINLGRQLHCSAIKVNLETNDRVANALLTMYAKNNKTEELALVFDKIPDPDIVSWSAAISGYAQNGFNEKSASLLCRMQKIGIKPTEYGFSSALSSCANLAALDQGRQFHSFALKLGCDSDQCVGNALVSMYSKCGNIDDASMAFHCMPAHDVTSWNTLIHGYAHHGHGRKALQVFDEMMEVQCIPNDATFVGILCACSHVGYVDEAYKYFDMMESHYGVSPSMAHYACMVDIMGRAGRLEEALAIIDKMPFEPDCLIWKTLLGSCRVYKDLELGRIVGERVISLFPKDSANYVLLSNLYVSCGEWEDGERVRKMMEERGVKKEGGWSCIEIRSKVHVFAARDQSHPRTQDIYLKLELLVKEMKVVGYVPDLSFALYDP